MTQLKPTYTLTKSTIKCSFCGMTSSNINDVWTLYCSNCNQFHRVHGPFVVPIDRSPTEFDRIWSDSPDMGKDCKCSRCAEPILRGIPMRMFVKATNQEYRYHLECLGMKIPYDEDEDIDF